MTNRVSSFSGFQPLKEIWLGDCYPVEFYKDLESDVFDAFAQITEWTKQDLAKIQKTLESFGVIVQRPTFTDNVDDYFYNGKLLKPPITPRDQSLTLGNEFYHLRSLYKKDPWELQLKDFESAGVTVYKQNDGPLSCLYPPSIVRVGQDIYIDYDTHKHVWGMITEVIIDWAKKFRVHVCRTGGHSDSVFCPVAPGIIVATHYLKQYKTTFPDWEVFHLKAPGFTGWFGNWHVNDKDIMNNKGFANHIEKHAIDWVGNFSETVFECNMLVVDQNNVIAIKEEPDLFDWLHQRGINVTLCEFRCRSFWDGGLHCLTTDIVREGNCENYFTQRPDICYLDWLS